MTIKVGVLGAGFIVPQHLAAYSEWPDVEVVAIASPDESARDDLAREFGIRRTYEDYTTLLNNVALDIVDVSLPTYLHHGAVMRALEQGAHVILEKPIAVDREEAIQMIQSAEQSKKAFYVSLSQRFVPEHQRVRDLIHEGAIGRLLYCHLSEIQDAFGRLNDPDHWFGTWDRGGGGTMMETGTHLVDLVRYLCGEVRAVTAVERQVLARQPGKGDDLAIMVLECANGGVAELTIFSGAVASPTEHKPKHFYGTKGSLHIDLDDNVNEHLVKWSVGEQEQTHDFAGKRLQKEVIDLPNGGRWKPVGYANWWERSVQSSVHHFLDHVLQAKPLMVTPSDALAALDIVRAAYRSSQSGQSVSL
jgi:predicted dehydrogenase